MLKFADLPVSLTLKCRKVLSIKAQPLSASVCEGNIKTNTKKLLYDDAGYISISENTVHWHGVEIVCTRYFRNDLCKRIGVELLL